MKHPTPWRVAFNQMFPEWHPQSQPHILDFDGNVVLRTRQTVDHPGLPDPDALELAERIVQAVNAFEDRK